VTAGLLLGSDTVSLYAPAADADAHGWALPAADPYWTGPGCLQLSPGASDPRANEGGGRGPYSPHQTPAGQLFLPPDCPLAEGSAAQARGAWWVVSQARLVADPTAPPGEGISCWAATVTASAQWEAASDGG
jgi:hypothetical protein